VGALDPARRSLRIFIHLWMSHNSVAPFNAAARSR
jgi:hypothetical protein